MTVEYTATLEDREGFFWYYVKHSPRAQCLFLLQIIAPACVLILYDLFTKHTVRPDTWMETLLVVVFELAVFPAGFPHMGKNDEFALFISSDGITPQVGSKRSEIPWSRIRNVFVTGEYVFIPRRGLVGFAIPRRAFRNNEERETFVQQLQYYRSRSNN